MPGKNEWMWIEKIGIPAAMPIIKQILWGWWWPKKKKGKK